MDDAKIKVKEKAIERLKEATEYMLIVRTSDNNWNRTADIDHYALSFLGMNTVDREWLLGVITRDTTIENGKVQVD